MKSLIIASELKMSSREISSLVESRHDKVKQSIERLTERGLITFTPMGGKSLVGRPGTEYLVSKRDSYVIVAQLSPEFTARLVDRWQELESGQQLVMPNFSDPAAAARAWAEQFEQAQIAIATKAEIGSRREASAMNTASQAVKKANKLEAELDKSRQFCTIKRMEMLCHGQKFSWRLLKAAGTEMGLEPIPVFDSNYGTVLAYHADVWAAAYAINLSELQGGVQ